LIFFESLEISKNSAVAVEPRLDALVARLINCWCVIVTLDTNPSYSSLSSPVREERINLSHFRLEVKNFWTQVFSYPILLQASWTGLSTRFVVTKRAFLLLLCWRKVAVGLLALARIIIRGVGLLVVLLLVAISSLVVFTNWGLFYEFVLGNLLLSWMRHRNLVLVAGYCSVGHPRLFTWHVGRCRSLKTAWFDRQISAMVNWIRIPNVEWWFLLFTVLMRRS